MKLLGLIALVTLVAACNAVINCRNMKNKGVDWWYVYKLPDINAHKSKWVQNGLGFLYMDGENKKWELSEKPLNDTKQAIAYTLSQLYKYKGRSYVYHSMYNDHHATGKGDSYRGHSKGVQLFDRNNGWWLIHSVPRFPPIAEYGYPNSGLRYGQSMLCISFDTKASLGEIAEQLYLTMPSFFEKGLPDSMASEYPRLAEVVLKTKTYTKGPKTRTAKLKSKGGKEFTHFAKNKKWEQDLYQHLVAPGIKHNLFVETWLNGPGDLSSGCNSSEYETWNNRAVHPSHIIFTSSKDHSKWAISDDPSDPWVCIGDINRQKSQDDRAGGTMCSLDKEIWNQYHESLDKKETCSGDIVPWDAKGSGPTSKCASTCAKCICQCMD